MRLLTIEIFESESGFGLSDLCLFVELIKCISFTNRAFLEK